MNSLRAKIFWICIPEFGNIPVPHDPGFLWANYIFINLNLCSFLYIFNTIDIVILQKVKIQMYFIFHIIQNVNLYIYSRDLLDVCEIFVNYSRAKMYKWIKHLPFVFLSKQMFYLLDALWVLVLERNLKFEKLKDILCFFKAG